MDWALAIERNHGALKAVLAGLLALLGVGADDREGSTAATLSRPLRNAVLSLLRPAESAARRLIVLAARGLTTPSSPGRSMPPGGIPSCRGRGGAKPPAFALFDRRKRFARRSFPQPRFIPRIRSFGDGALMPLFSPPPAAPVLSDALIDAARLHKRVQALRAALDDLPRQARRLARWRARRRTAQASLAHRSPLRPGQAPGHRRKQGRDVDGVLAECHALALDALALEAPGPDASGPDTS